MGAGALSSVELGLKAKRMIIERTVRPDAIRGAILGALAFLGVVLVLALVVFWF
jgi:hypothetical protein